MQQDPKIIIRFPELSDLEAGRAAQKLKQLIQEQQDSKDAESLSIELQRAKAGSQNLGDILMVILTSGAVTAIAAGVRAFIATRGSKVVIETEGGTVVAYGDGARNIDTARTVEMLNKARSPEPLPRAEAKAPEKAAAPKKAAAKGPADPASPVKQNTGRKKTDKPAAPTGTSRRRGK